MTGAARLYPASWADKRPLLFWLDDVVHRDDDPGSAGEFNPQTC